MNIMIKLLLGLFLSVSCITLLGSINKIQFIPIPIIIYGFWLFFPNRYFYIESSKLLKDTQRGKKE